MKLLSHEYLLHVIRCGSDAEEAIPEAFHGIDGKSSRLVKVPPRG